MNIKSDSRKIKQGDTFIALHYQNNGHKYIEDAIKNGAQKIICEHGLYSVDTLIVNDTHEYLVKYLKENYYEEIKDMKLIAITGTNGKTTTAYLIHQMLNISNIKCGYIGTIGFYINEKIKNLNNTTPDILDVYEMLLECKEKDCMYVTLEASSHALIQNRLEGLLFDYAVFTNLTRDHLDYHKTIKNYCLAKQILFKKIKENGKAIINADDPYKDYFILENNNITYGLKGKDYQINSYEILKDKTKFIINNEEYETTLIGKHNIYNVLVCIIILKELSLDKTIIEQLTPPIGRMEKINYNDNLIVIDYAHTPDAVEKMLNCVKELKFKNIYTIIGCGGNRDKEKRSIMGDIALKNSSLVIFTTDNPRNENPQKIIEDMISSNKNTNYEIIENREFAIRKGIQLLDKSDILLILGKGHETYQIINNIKYDFSDKKVVLKYI